MHTMARSVVVKGVELPERLLDETALFLHRVVANLPPDKQRMLERLRNSDENLHGRKALLVDDDARNIFALSSVLERRGMEVLTATTGREAISILKADQGISIVLMDIMMPEMDGYETMQAIRSDASLQAASDHCAHREGDERRPREMPGGGRLGLFGEAGQHGAAAFGASHLAASLGQGEMHRNSDPVNILLVDDQPAKLLSYEVILEELGENLIKATSGRQALEQLLRHEVAVILVDVSMPELDGFELAAMIREHPRFTRTAIIFVSAVHLVRNRQLARLPGWRRGLSAGPDRAGAPARQRCACFCELLQEDPPAREPERRTGAARGRAHRRARRRERGPGKASRSAHARAGGGFGASWRRCRSWKASASSPAGWRTTSTIFSWS